MSDPNGWVRNPPSTFVKVHGTSRDDLNNQLGIVLGYQADRGRYVVHMAVSNNQASLKPDNLKKASYFEQMQAQYQIMQNNPQVQAQFRQVYNRIQSTVGVKPEYVAGGLVGLLLLACYFVGFSKTILALSFCMMGVMVILPDLERGAQPAEIAKNAPLRLKALIRQNVPYVGARIADSDALTAAVVGVMVLFFVSAMVRSTGPPPATSSGSGGGGGLFSSLWGGGGSAATATAAASASGADTAVPYLSKPSPVLDQNLLQDYYKKGFEDAQAGHDFGHSLPAPELATRAMRAADEAASRYDEDGEFGGSVYRGGATGATPPPVNPPPKKAGFDMTFVMALFYVGRTIFSMGQTAEGGWDYELAMANLQTMDMMRMGFLALSSYRIISSLMRMF